LFRVPPPWTLRKKLFNLLTQQHCLPLPNFQTPNSTFKLYPLLLRLLEIKLELENLNKALKSPAMKLKFVKNGESRWFLASAEALLICHSVNFLHQLKAMPRNCKKVITPTVYFFLTLSGIIAG
jgi:hypothetical protein